MLCDYLRMNDLSLLFELFIGCDLFQTLANVNQLAVQLVYLTFFGQLHQMCLFMSVEIDWYWFVGFVFSDKANCNQCIGRNLCLIRLALQENLGDIYVGGN